MSYREVEIVRPVCFEDRVRGFLFDNDLQVVVVEADECSVPAVAVSVGVGMLNDPKDCPGLAHFCEHMLFKGSRSYPEEEGFKSFLSLHSGSSNAFTERMRTTFYATVAAEYLGELIPRFLEFFSCPLFNEGGVEREVHAVHSEDERNCTSDFWRCDEMMQTHSHPSHPLSQYGTGNKFTLHESGNLAAKVSSFFAKYYTSKAMCVTVYSTQPAESIVSLIAPCVAQLHNGEKPCFQYVPTTENILPCGSWFNFKSLRTQQTVDILFEVHSPQSRWKNADPAYISHVLGHECNTSVLGVLQAKGLATALSAGAVRVDCDKEAFKVSISLTQAGLHLVDQVVQLVFSGVGVAISNGVNTEVYQSMVAQDRLDFDTQECNSAVSTCIMLCRGGLDHDLTHSFPSHYPLEDDLNGVLQYCKSFVPDKCIVILSWDKFEEECTDSLRELPNWAQVPLTHETKYRRAKYSRLSIPNKVKEGWKAALSGPFPPELQLPSINPYVITQWVVHPPDPLIKPPIMKLPSPRGAVYVRSSHLSRSVKSAFLCNIMSPVAYENKLNRFYFRVLVGIVEELTTAFRYEGELAALANSISFQSMGMQIGVSGPNQHLISYAMTLLRRVLDAPTWRDASLDMYNRHATTIRDKLENFRCSAASRIAADTMFQAVSYVRYTALDIFEASDSATYNGYRQFLSQYWSAGFLFEIFLCGNMESLQSIEGNVLLPTEQLLSQFPIPSQESMPLARDCLLKEPAREATALGAPVITSMDLIYLPALMPENKNIGSVVSICFGPSTPRTCAIASCIAKLLSPSFFQSIRSEEAIGYVASLSTFNYLEATYLHVAVESAVESIDGLYVLSRIVAYFDAVERAVDSICEEGAVNNLFQCIIAKLKEKETSVAKECSTLYAEYMSPLGFTGKEEEINVLQGLHHSDVKEYLRDYVFNHRTKAKALAVILDRSHSAAPYSWSSAGTCTLPLPPFRSLVKESDCVADRSLPLSTFESGASQINLHVWQSVEEYKRVLTRLPYTCRFREVAV